MMISSPLTPPLSAPCSPLKRQTTSMFASIPPPTYGTPCSMRSKANDDDDEERWSSKESSPTDSDGSASYHSDSVLPSSASTSPLASPTTSTRATGSHSAPVSPPCPPAQLPSSGPSKPLVSSLHPHRSSTPSSRPSPTRLRALNLMTPLAAPPQHAGNLPKSQPLSRALFARMASDTPHAGMSPKKAGGKAQKLIVPTKGFKTTFELGLTASELARR